MLTLTDMFCGAGGSSIGASGVPGVQLKLALNHWRRAIETHQHNFDAVAHDCADVSATDPRRYRPTDLLWASPECTNHSLAKGRSRASTDPNLFESDRERDRRWSAERSRATMFDVVRFAERHQYAGIVVENVVDARQWVLWPSWWQAMELLGYQGRSVYLNSGHFEGVPQSRDRMYVVWWRRGATAPDLDFRPAAWCDACDVTVAAVQSWRRPQRPWGRYRRQYDYRCPGCARLVEPPMDAAATAIDWSDLGTRIGDRDKPLAANTLRRIEAGLRKYGIRTGPLAGANAAPYMVELRGGGSEARSVNDPLATVCAGGNHHGLVVPPGAENALVVRNNGDGADSGWASTPVAEPLRTLTTMGAQSLLVPDGALVMRNNTTGNRGDDARMVTPVEEPLRTLTTIINQSLLVPYYTAGGRDVGARPVTDPVGTVTSRDKWGLLVPQDRMSHPASKTPRSTDEPMATATARNDVALAVPDVDDCLYRMLHPEEVQRGMAMHAHADGRPYVVTGNKRERVAQCGNAVTPPPARWLLGRVAAALAG